MLSKISGFLTDRLILNSLRHTINSVRVINKVDGKEVSMMNPLNMLISITFTAIGVLAAGPVT